MECPKCGAQLVEDANFCHKCGVCVSGDSPEQKNKVKAKYYVKNVVIVIAMTISALAVFIAAMMSVYMIMNDMGPFKPEPTPTPEAVPSPTAAPTEEPLPTSFVPEETAPADYINGKVEMNPEYLTYENSDYGFECDYPSHFKMYNDGGAALYTVRTKDGSTSQIISAKEAGDENVKSSMDEFIDDNAGKVVHKDYGEDFYEVNIRRGSVEHYKYCKFEDGTVYWFEFMYPAEYHEAYEGYINHINNSLKIY